MARSKIVGIEMSNGTFANYAPGLMVIGDPRKGGNTVHLSESDIDELEGLLAQRKAILAAAAIAPALKWKRHPSADKVVSAQTDEGLYVIEPRWNQRYTNVVAGYHVSFFAAGEQTEQALLSLNGRDYTYRLEDRTELGTEMFSPTGSWRGHDDVLGELKMADAKKVAQSHVQQLFDKARSAAA